MIDGLRFLAHGYRLERVDAAFGSSAQAEQQRRRDEWIAIPYNSNVVHQRRIAMDRENARRAVARYEMRARWRIAERRLEVVA